MTREAQQNGLRRELTFLDAVMINVGSMIGSGIFLVPAVVAGALPDLSWIILVWVAGGLASLAGALTIAELGAAIPKAGGLFEYLSETVSPLSGFLYGWSSFTIINSGSIAAVAVGSATYLGYFIPMSTLGVRVVAVSSIVVLTFIHSFGVKIGARVQNWFTVTKFVMVLAFAVTGLFFVSGASTGPAPDSSLPAFPGIIVPVGIAFIAVLWAYDGWIEITMVGSEVKDPQRTIPAALVVSTALMIVLYVLVTFAYHSLLTLQEVASSSLVASDAAQKILGPPGAAAVAVAVLISTVGTNNGFVFTIARIYYAMAEQGLFFASFRKVHPVYRTPVNALVGQALWASALVFTGTFEQLTAYVVFASWIFYMLACVGVLRRRRNTPHAARPFSVPLYPVLPLLFIICSCFVAGSAIAQSPADALLGVLLIVSGVPAYYFWSGKRRNWARTD